MRHPEGTCVSSKYKKRERGAGRVRRLFPLMPDELYFLYVWLKVIVPLNVRFSPLIPPVVVTVQGPIFLVCVISILFFTLVVLFLITSFPGIDLIYFFSDFICYACCGYDNSNPDTPPVYWCFAYNLNNHFQKGNRMLLILRSVFLFCYFGIILTTKIVIAKNVFFDTFFVCTDDYSRLVFIRYVCRKDNGFLIEEQGTPIYDFWSFQVKRHHPFLLLKLLILVQCSVFGTPAKTFFLLSCSLSFFIFLFSFFISSRFHFFINREGAKTLRKIFYWNEADRFQSS